MAYQFPKNPPDGEVVSIKQPNGTEFIYTYNKNQNTWELAGQGVDLDQNNIVIFTDNVQARVQPRPDTDETYQSNRTDSSFASISNQRDINWALHDAVNAVEGSVSVWVSNRPPTEEKYVFWWNTDTLELLFNYNEQWWPVSIPPSQINVLKEIIDGLGQDVTQVRGDIALNKKDIDDNLLDVTERIDGIEADVNSNSGKVENAAFVNQDNSFASNRTNTFNGPVTLGSASIKAPSDNWSNPTFEVRGTAQTGTKDSRILFSIPASGQAGKMEVRYRGAINSNDSVTNKGYVDGKARASEISLDPFIDPDQEFASLFDDEEIPSQADMNSEIAYSLFNARRKQVRAQTNIDFNQNTIVDGQWKLIKPSQAEAFPEAGEFMAIGADGNPTTEWATVKRLTINGTDYNDRATLADIRKGAVFIIQDVILNTFVQFSCTAINIIGNPQGGQFWVEADVRVYINRALGEAPVGEICEIRITSPHPAISTFGEPPVVSDDGFLWYDEQAKKLYVSDWDDDQDNNGDAVWVPVGDSDDKLPLAGGKMSGVLNMNDNYIANVHDPDSATDAVNRRWANDNYYSKNKKLETTEPIWIRPIGPDGQPEGPKGTANMLVVNQLGDVTSGSVMRVCKGGDDILKVTNDRKLDMSKNSIVQLATPESDSLTHAANVEYVNNYVDNAVQGVNTYSGYAWEYRKEPSNSAAKTRLYWFDPGDNETAFNISPIALNGTIDLPNFAYRTVETPLLIYTRDATTGFTHIICSAKTDRIKVDMTAQTQYIRVHIKNANNMRLIWSPNYPSDRSTVYVQLGGFIP